MQDGVNRAPQKDGSPIAIVSAERPLNPEDNVRTCESTRYG